MVEVTESDLAAALKHTGFDSVADLHYWAQDNNELNRFDALTALLATHREAAAKAERDRIVAWLRDDARLTEIEARRILGNLTTLTQADTDNWAKLILMKHGIADTLEKQP